jgi:NADH-quinone oxidoreductase subunit L
MPHVSWGTLVVLGVLTLLVGGAVAGIIGKNDSRLSLAEMLEQARPAGTLANANARWLSWTWPNEHASHADAVKIPVTWLATGTWLLGIGLATAMYAWKILSPAEVRRAFEPIYQLLWNKWWFDELYDFLFVKPSLVIGRFIAGIDKNWIDVFLNGLASSTVAFSRWWDFVADRGIIDGVANLIAGWTYSLGLSLRILQTGRLRQYVMFIVVGAIGLFVLISFFWTPGLAR